MKSALTVFASAALAVSGLAFAESEADQITMYSAAVETPSDVFSMIDQVNVFPQSQSEGDSVDPSTLGNGVTIEQIVNLGQKAWTVIKANKPVANMKYNFANALPLGITSSAMLSGFSDVQSSSVRLWGKNGLGMTVYDVTLTAVHQYGANYQGKGHFLETVSVIPSHVSVLWGYTVNYNVDNVSSVNGGTAQDPIAKVALQAKFRVETVVKTSERNTVYQFRGDSPKAQISGM